MDTNQKYDPNEKLKIPHVPYDALIKIEISGTFLKRCQVLLLALSQEMGQERLDEAFKKFKDTNAEPADLQEATLFIITSLVGEVEKQALEQKKTVEVELTRDEIAKMVYGEPTS